MPFLQICLCLMRSWFVLPGQDPTPWTLWVGPHNPEYAFCYIDATLDKAYTNDLPKCLYVLQSLGRLDLAPRFYNAPVDPVMRLVYEIRAEEARKP